MTWAGFDREKISSDLETSNERLARRQKKRWDAQDRVRELLEEKAPWLMAGTTPPPESAEVIKLLLKLVDSNGDAEDLRLRRNFLIRGIDTGRKEKRWQIPMPAQTLRAPLPKPPITVQNFGDLGRVEKLRQVLLTALHSNDFPDLKQLKAIRKYGHSKAPLTTTDLDAGLVLFAVIVFGGVNNKTKLEAIAVCGTHSLFCYQNIAWMDWPKLSKTGAGIDRWHRWYPEQISGFLLARAHRNKQLPLVKCDSSLNCSELIWKQVEAIMALLPLNGDGLPRTLTQLLSWVTTWLNFNIPPFLAAYANGKIDCASLPPEVHFRILSAQPVMPDPIHREKVTELPPRKPIPTENINNDLVFDFTVLRRDLRAALKQNLTKPKTITLLNQYLARDDLSPTFIRLAEWVRQLCDHHKTGDVRRRLSSIHAYLAIIDTPLAVALESRDPANLDSEEFEELYAEILGSLGKKRAGSAVHPLMLFHRFLVSTHGVPQEMGDVFEGHHVGGSVDANLITEQEYVRTRDLLEPEISGEPHRLAMMQKTALMLGFRGGLRRGEVRRLRVGDICGAVFGVAYIRTTDRGQVKTTAGIRNLPLAGHFSNDEMALLRTFVISRIREISGSDDLARILSPYDEDSRNTRLRPLFEQTNNPGELIPEKSLFEPILDALIRSTGDPTSHFHLLRKGEQNWVFAGLMEEELPGCSLQFDPSGAIAKASRRLNSELLATNGPDKRKLWALSASVGHASPTTTLGSYLSCLDWLLSFALQQQSPLLSARLLSGLTGLTVNNIRVQRSNRKIDGRNYLFWVSYSDRDWLSQVVAKLEAVNQGSSPTPHLAQRTTAITIAKPPLPGADTIELVFAVVRKNTDLVTKARQLGQLAEVVKPWIAWAIALEQLVGMSPAKAAQRALLTSNENSVDKYGITIKRAIPVFLPILQGDERRRVNKWTAAIHHFAQEHPDRAAHWLTMFWTNRRPKEHAIGFREVASAGVFVETLHALCPAERQRMVYRFHPRANASALPPREQVTAWSIGLGIPITEIALCDSIVRQSDGDGIGTLTVALHHEHKLSDETQTKRGKGIVPQKPWTKTRSIALEGACYVTTIWLLSGMYANDANTSATPSPRISNASLFDEPSGMNKKADKATTRANPDLKPELVILCGIPGSGKTKLYDEEFSKTHFHLALNSTASESRDREWGIFEAAMVRRDSIVIDNNNLTPKQRERYIIPARASGYRIVGIELQVDVPKALERLSQRKHKPTEAALSSLEKKLVSLQLGEGFDSVSRRS